MLIATDSLLNASVHYDSACPPFPSKLEEAHVNEVAWQVEELLYHLYSENEIDALLPTAPLSVTLSAKHAEAVTTWISDNGIETTVLYEREYMGGARRSMVELKRDCERGGLNLSIGKLSRVRAVENSVKESITSEMLLQCDDDNRSVVLLSDIGDGVWTAKIGGVSVATSINVFKSLTATQDFPWESFLEGDNDSIKRAGEIFQASILFGV